MISVYQLKTRFQQLLLPVLKYLHSKNITANQITWSAIIWSASIGLMLLKAQDWQWVWLILPFGFFVRMALNALDGMMARRYQMQSIRGEILNEMGDVISDIFICLPLVILFPSAAIFIWIFLLLAVLNEFAGVLTKAISGQRRYDGPMGKSDRALLLGIIGLLAFFWEGVLNYLPIVWVGASLLLLLSTKTRLSHVNK